MESLEKTKKVVTGRCESNHDLHVTGFRAYVLGVDADVPSLDE